MATTYTYTSSASADDKYIIKLDSDIYTVNDGNADIIKIKKDVIEQLSDMINNGTLSFETIIESLKHKGGNNKSRKMKKSAKRKNRTCKVLM